MVQVSGALADLSIGNIITSSPGTRPLAAPVICNGVVNRGPRVSILTVVRRLTSDVRVSDPLNRPTEAKHRSDTNRTVEECLVSTFQRYLCDSQARTPTGDARARPRVPLSAAACMHASGASGARHRGRAQRPHTTARACACTKRSRPGSPPGTTHTAHTYPGPTCTHTPTSRACTRDHARSRRAARTRRRARRPLLGREVAKDIV